MDASSIATGALLLAPLLMFVFAGLWLKSRARAKELEQRFKPILDIEAQTRVMLAQADEKIRALRVDEGRINSDIIRLREEYKSKYETFDRLKKQVAIFDERISFAEMGVYEPHFEFTDSEEYKTAIEKVRGAQKEMVSAKTAVTCKTEWAVDGNRAAGKTMTNRNIRLTLRAFNGECDAAISNVRWNNANAMEKRIENAFVQISKLNESNHVIISGEYLKLKLNELFLTHEYREKIKQEKEQRAEAARLSREEQKLMRDLEKAEEEEVHYERMLAKAKSEAARFTGEQLSVFQQQIATLERDLADAHAKVERAQSMAERTRTGYVYIISNVGSFGEGVVKIGLTRRLDPSDRVRELGDASVPFIFDTHAMIYSEDAPSLERALHSEFERGRVNTSNFRKEFFRVSIEEVHEAVTRLAPDAPFFKDIEAQEFRETISRRQAALEAPLSTEAFLPQEI